MRGLCAALFDLALSGIASAINTRANWRAFRPRFYVTSGLWRKCVFPTPMGSDQILSFLGRAVTSSLIMPAIIEKVAISAFTSSENVCTTNPK